MRKRAPMNLTEKDLERLQEKVSYAKQTPDSAILISLVLADAILESSQKQNEALKDLDKAKAGLLSCDESFGWAMDEMTEEVSDSLGRLFQAIYKAKVTIIAKE